MPLSACSFKSTLCWELPALGVVGVVVGGVVEDRGVGDAEVEDGVTRLPRYRGPHSDAWTSALRKRRALGLRTTAQGWRTATRGMAVLRQLGGSGWRGVQMT